MNNDKEKLKLVYIVGTGRSGSTLLTTALGQISEIFSAGEMEYISDLDIHSQLCGCGKQFLDCEFWSTINFEGKKGLQNLPLKKFEQLRNRFEKLGNIPRFLVDGHSSFYDDLVVYEDLLEKLLFSIAKRASVNIIVDSSKVLPRLFILNRLKNVEIVVIHLIRDPRAVAYSWTKHYIRPEVVTRIEFMHRYNPIRTAIRWLYKNFLLNISSKRFDNYFRLFYEDFVASPKKALNSVLLFLERTDIDIGFIAGDVLLKQKINHTLSGNPLRFDPGNIIIMKDNKWRREMKFLNKFSVSLVTWSLEFFYYIKRKNNQ